MRVLLAVPWDQEYGGVATVVGNLAASLVTRGHKVFFLHPSGTDRLSARQTGRGYDGFELNLRAPLVRERGVRSALGFGLFLPSVIWQLVSLLKRHRIQVVNVHYPIRAFVYLATCRSLLPRVRLVTSVHGADLFPAGTPRSRYPWSQRHILSSSDLIVAPSHAFLRDVVTVFPRVAPKAIFIHNGIDVRELSQDHVTSDDASRFGRFVLCIANHDPRKGVDVLLRAFAQCGLQTSVKLVLVGDGPQRGELESLADSLGIREHTVFLGQQPRTQIATLLRSCEVFVLPSRSESFGIAAVEAMACGKPVVASAVGGIPEIIEHGITGLLVKREDSVGMARALRTLLDDRSISELMGQRGASVALARFTRERAGAEYEREFERLTTPERGTSVAS